MSVITELLSDGSAILSTAGVDGAARDARILLAAACGCEPSRLMMLDDATSEQITSFHGMIAARAKFQPVSQIVGFREFWGRRFRVTPHVLDPRPETETLIEQALVVGGTRILDLGTGSGAIAVTLACEIPNSAVTATDISTAALDVARENACLHDADRIEFSQTSWWDDVSGQFDLIVSNPPYISELEMAELSPDVREWEPHLALTPGGDGLDAYRIIASRLAEFMMPNGTALFEIGHLQGKEVTEIFTTAGTFVVKIYLDLDEHDRVMSITHQNSN